MVIKMEKGRYVSMRVIVFMLFLVVCAQCFLPVEESADDDLVDSLLSRSDFCRCRGDDRD